MNNSLGPKILCVDDEPNILQAFKRQLRDKFNLDIATGGEAGLAAISENGPYAVVVSDMRMPCMDGAEFLQRVKKLAPETVRLMLTGNADQGSAVRAVNEGNIYRFLNKPCSTEDLTKALDDACAQHKLLTAEKELLQNTLSGSIKLLTDILSFLDPDSFGQSLKLRSAVQRLIPEIAAPNSWEIELGAMLANIGYVTVPGTILLKHRKGLPLSNQERILIDKIPEVGSNLISNIPRLEGVAKIVRYQDFRYDGRDEPTGQMTHDKLPLGARLLKILKDFIQLQNENFKLYTALERLKERVGCYDPKLLELVIKTWSQVKQSVKDSEETQVFEITSSQLFIGQTLLSNIETKEGVLLISAGSTLTEALLERLRNYSSFVGIKEPIRVDCLIPAGKG